MAKENKIKILVPVYSTTGEEKDYYIEKEVTVREYIK